MSFTLPTLVHISLPSNSTLTSHPTQPPPHKSTHTSTIHIYSTLHTDCICTFIIYYYTTPSIIHPPPHPPSTTHTSITPYHIPAFVYLHPRPHPVKPTKYFHHSQQIRLPPTHYSHSHPSPTIRILFFIPSPAFNILISLFLSLSSPRRHRPHQSILPPTPTAIQPATPAPAPVSPKGNDTICTSPVVNLPQQPCLFAIARTPLSHHHITSASPSLANTNILNQPPPLTTSNKPHHT